MGKPRVLILTTAYHHMHRFRLHNFLPYLSKYLDLDVIDVPILSYDKCEGESLYKFLLRVVCEIIIINPIKLVSGNSGTDVYVIRALFPGDFGALTSIPLLSVLLRKLKYRQYQAILAAPFIAGLLALIAKKQLSGVPVIYEDVDRFYDFFKNPYVRTFAKTIEYATIKYSDAIVAVSPHLYVEDSTLRNGRSTYFIPNGIEYEKFYESSKRVRKRERYSIVYVGAVEWWSGLDIAVKVLKRVVKEVNNAKLYIIGEHRTPFGIYLQRLIKKLNLADNVLFLGRRPYDFVIDFLPRCRIGILMFPRSEVTVKAFPYKVLEYCASGTPVVMTNVTVLAKLVSEHKAGRVHGVEDLEGLAASIIELMLNDKLWKEYSENATKLASLFDVKRLARMEANVIALLCGFSYEW